MPLNAYHPDDAQNSYEWGTNIAEAVEVALAAFERVSPNADAGSKCVIAEAIIENADEPGAEVDWRRAYEGVEDYAPRYKAARRAYNARVAA
jgi:hypothetical protein